MKEAQQCHHVPHSVTAALVASRVKMGFYMGGAIYPDQRACSCGGKFIRKTFRGEVYFACEKCDKDPTLFRIRKYMPGLNGGTGRKVDIRYDATGKRLTSIDQARAMLKYIDFELENGEIDLDNFLVKESNNELILRNFAKKYLDHFRLSVERGENSPSTLKIYTDSINLHVLPHIGSMNIRHITTGTMKDLNDTLKVSQSYRKNIIGVLHSMLTYAYELNKIDSIPKTLKFKQMELQNPERFLTYEQQDEVLSHITNPYYRAAIIILIETALRPCDVRPLKWSDIDLERRIIRINKHTTKGNQLGIGRKSSLKAHEVYLSDKALEALLMLPIPFNKDSYLLPGMRPDTFITEKVLSNAWNKAISKTKIPHIDLYRGTKSSSLSQLLQQGYTEEQICELAGITKQALKKYAQHTDKSRIETQKKLVASRK